ncbi:MAG: polynucleotide adenylyltransferase PcnB, partial [Leptospiraceae bacterium]|nr:polynucleotide adenylyltransferase PcnB [Leptospiraceae bacterium]
SDFADSSIGRRLSIADKMLDEREDLTTIIFTALLICDLVSDVFTGQVKGNITEYVRQRMLPACERMQIPGKDRDRLLQMFISQTRFRHSGKSKKSRPDVFRNKVFFYEAFMLFKIYTLSINDEESIQKAMFWEIGPRGRPPEVNKIISAFPPRRNQRRNGGRGGQNRSGGNRPRKNRTADKQ